MKPHLVSIFLFTNNLLFFVLDNSTHTYLLFDHVENNTSNLESEILVPGIERDIALDSSRLILSRVVDNHPVFVARIHLLKPESILLLLTSIIELKDNLLFLTVSETSNQDLTIQ